MTWTGIEWSLKVARVFEPPAPAEFVAGVIEPWAQRFVLEG